MSPEVSVIMSVFNSAKYLAEAIESILNQSFIDFEFIIINDASTDDSLSIVEGYAKKDGRIILIDNKDNIGLTKSLNLGLRLAKGIYIARTDSDDVSLPGRLEKQYAFLKKNKGIFLVGSGALEIASDGRFIRRYPRITSPLLLKWRLPKKNNIYHPSIVFRNEGDNFYREKFVYSQDYDFFLCLLTKGKRLANMQDVLIAYRINPEAISRIKNAKQQLFAEKAQELYHQRMKYGRDEYDKFNPEEIISLNI